MQTMQPVFSVYEEQQLTTTANTHAIEHVIHIMHTHLHELLTLEELASAACLSPYYFNRIFRRQTGIPPCEFLAALRFQKARHLLLATSLSVTDICFEVGYTSTGSFSSRFTQRVGISPRVLRQRAHEFAPPPLSSDSPPPIKHISRKPSLLGHISTPTSFSGTIYIGLFPGPIPQGSPIRCTRRSSSGLYQLNDIPDGLYHLLAAAFPASSHLPPHLLPEENLLLASNTRPLVVHNGHISGNPNLTLHPPYLTDAPLVMALPLL